MFVSSINKSKSDLYNLSCFILYFSNSVNALSQAISCDIFPASFNLATFTAIKEEVLPIYDVCEYALRKLNELYPDILKERYGINSVNDDFIETLETIGKKRGCLIKGGEIDYDKVINLIMLDIKQGIIRGVTFDRL